MLRINLGSLSDFLSFARWIERSQKMTIFDRKGKINMAISHWVGYWRCGSPTMATFISVGTVNTPPRKHRHPASGFGCSEPAFCASISPAPNPGYKHRHSPSGMENNVEIFWFIEYSRWNFLGVALFVWFFFNFDSPLYDESKIPQKHERYGCLC